MFLDSKEKRLQENQYEYPYHYIPSIENDKLSQVKYWSWGFRYMGGIKVVVEEVLEKEFNSLIDIGCGDGRFLRDLNGVYDNKKMVGVDYSARAIDLARAMSPNVKYVCENILERDITDRFGMATLIEVLEHIPPEDIENFLDATCRLLAEQATLIATVPHVNKSVSDKHYQHFDRSKLQRLLEPRFEKLKFIYFDDIKSNLLKYFQSIVGGNGNHFVITNKYIMSLFWRMYKNNYLYTTKNRCGRIAVVATR
jgi:2-polyprenyl-3-methyl-5-hydroxy-6-metoxy-1,4-benzoquinol methylase